MREAISKLKENKRLFQGPGLEAREAICRVEFDIKACINSWKQIRKTDENRLYAMNSRFFTMCLALDFLLFLVRLAQCLLLLFEFKKRIICWIGA